MTNEFLSYVVRSSTQIGRWSERWCFTWRLKNPRACFDECFLLSFFHRSLKIALSKSKTPLAVSCERRNISAIIRATGSGEARCSVNEQTMEGD